MDKAKSVAEWLAERRLALDELVASSGLDDKVVRAIVHGRYTPSPQQRRRLAAALGVDPACISWGHSTPVEHIQGHGPQFGRSP